MTARPVRRSRRLLGAPAAPTAADRGKRPVSQALTGPYGHPFHPILVTIPIGAWAASLVFDVGALIVDDPGFLARGVAWLIALGVLGALAAATVGFLDLLGIPTGTRGFATGLQHMSLMLVVAGALGGKLAYRYGVRVVDEAAQADGCGG